MNELLIKLCASCNNEKSLDSFYFKKKTNDYFNECKECATKRNRNWKLINHKQMLEQKRKKRQSDDGLRLNKEYREKNKEKILERNRIYIKNNPEKYRESKRKRWNKYKHTIEFKQYKLNNKQKNAQYGKIWRENNKQKIKKQKKLWHEQKILTDENYRVKHYIRKYLRDILRNKKQHKSCRTKEYFGCDFSELKTHIESLFLPDMNWENWGLGFIKNENGDVTRTKSWHLDHIIPCAAFDFKDIDQQKKCFHYTNLRPLWAEDNLKKNDFMPDGSRGRDWRIKQLSLIKSKDLSL